MTRTNVRTSFTDLTKLAKATIIFRRTERVILPKFVKLSIHYIYEHTEKDIDIPAIRQSAVLNLHTGDIQI